MQGGDADALHLEMADLCSRKRSPELVRVRELVMVLGVEGYGLKVRELAATLKKTPDGIPHALARGVRRRADDEGFRVDLGKLDRAIATQDKSIKACPAPFRRAARFNSRLPPHDSHAEGSQL